MKIIIKVKPRKIEAQGKSELLAKALNGLNYSISNLGSGYSKIGGGYIYGYSLEKHKQKFSQTRLKNGKTKYKKVKEKKWIMHLYRFDSDLLKVAGLKVKQGPRTFKLELNDAG